MKSARPLLTALLLVLGSVAAASLGQASPISPSSRQALISLRESIHGWVRLCDDAMNYGDGCDQGDLTLFAGLLCLSGETARCPDVSRAQAADGSWWRAPKRIGQGGAPVFSRDQTMGLLSYLTATREKAGAHRWADWVYANGRKFPVLHSDDEGSLIPPGLTFYSVCKDDFHLNCLITPPLWGLIGRVWQWMGADTTSQMQEGQKLDSDEAALLAEVSLPQKPYERHLAAVEVLIRRAIGRQVPGVSKAAAILAGHEDHNAFFQFLSEGPTDAVALLTLAQCPAQPLATDPGDWLWMADNPPAQPFRTSMGWDCIFMTNLLLNTDLQKQLGF